MDLSGFLTWIVASGGNVVIASWALERIAWYQAKTAQMKQWIFFGVSALLAVSSYSVVTFVPAGDLAIVAPFFLIVYGTFANVFLGNAFHKTDKL